MTKLLIPKITITINYIVSELEEEERQETFRLKRFKQLKTITIKRETRECRHCHRVLPKSGTVKHLCIKCSVLFKQLLLGEIGEKALIETVLDNFDIMESRTPAGSSRMDLDATDSDESLEDGERKLKSLKPCICQIEIIEMLDKDDDKYKDVDQVQLQISEPYLRASRRCLISTPNFSMQQFSYKKIVDLKEQEQDDAKTDADCYCPPNKINILPKGSRMSMGVFGSRPNFFSSRANFFSSRANLSHGNETCICHPICNCVNNLPTRVSIFPQNEHYYEDKKFTKKCACPLSVYQGPSKLSLKSTIDHDFSYPISELTSKPNLIENTEDCSCPSKTVDGEILNDQCVPCSSCEPDNGPKNTKEPNSFMASNLLLAKQGSRPKVRYSEDFSGKKKHMQLLRSPPVESLVDNDPIKSVEYYPSNLSPIIKPLEPEPSKLPPPLLIAKPSQLSSKRCPLERTITPESCKPCNPSNPNYFDETILPVNTHVSSDLKLAPDAENNSSSDEQHSILEKKYKEIVKVTRKRNPNGTISEERKIVTVEIQIKTLGPECGYCSITKTEVGDTISCNLESESKDSDSAKEYLNVDKCSSNIKEKVEPETTSSEHEDTQSILMANNEYDNMPEKQDKTSCDAAVGSSIILLKELTTEGVDQKVFTPKTNDDSLLEEQAKTYCDAAVGSSIVLFNDFTVEGIDQKSSTPKANNEYDNFPEEQSKTYCDAAVGSGIIKKMSIEDVNEKSSGISKRCDECNQLIGNDGNVIDLIKNLDTVTPASTKTLRVDVCTDTDSLQYHIKPNSTNIAVSTTTSASHVTTVNIKIPLAQHSPEVCNAKMCPANILKKSLFDDVNEAPFNDEPAMVCTEQTNTYNSVNEKTDVSTTCSENRLQELSSPFNIATYIEETLKTLLPLGDIVAEPFSKKVSTEKISSCLMKPNTKEVPYKLVPSRPCPGKYSIEQPCIDTLYPPKTHASKIKIKTCPQIFSTDPKQNVPKSVCSIKIIAKTTTKRILKPTSQDIEEDTTYTYSRDCQFKKKCHNNNVLQDSTSESYSDLSSTNQQHSLYDPNKKIDTIRPGQTPIEAAFAPSSMNKFCAQKSSKWCGSESLFDAIKKSYVPTTQSVCIDSSTCCSQSDSFIISTDSSSKLKKLSDSDVLLCTSELINTKPSNKTNTTLSNENRSVKDTSKTFLESQNKEEEVVKMSQDMSCCTYYEHSIAVGSNCANTSISSSRNQSNSDCCDVSIPHNKLNALFGSILDEMEPRCAMKESDRNGSDSPSHTEPEDTKPKSCCENQTNIQLCLIDEVFTPTEATKLPLSNKIQIEPRLSASCPCCFTKHAGEACTKASTMSIGTNTKAKNRYDPRSILDIASLRRISRPLLSSKSYPQMLNKGHRCSVGRRYTCTPIQHNIN